jgi:hypothetical protein
MRVNVCFLMIQPIYHYVIIHFKLIPKRLYLVLMDNSCKVSTINHSAVFTLFRKTITRIFKKV